MTIMLKLILDYSFVAFIVDDASLSPNMGSSAKLTFESGSEDVRDVDSVTGEYLLSLVIYLSVISIY